MYKCFKLGRAYAHAILAQALVQPFFFRPPDPGCFTPEVLLRRLYMGSLVRLQRRHLRPYMHGWFTTTDHLNAIYSKKKRTTCKHICPLNSRYPWWVGGNTSSACVKKLLMVTWHMWEEQFLPTPEVPRGGGPGSEFI